MVLAYLTYGVLLIISPIIGKYSLGFVYPDVKTYVNTKKWILYALFGLGAYVPAAAIGLFELVTPLYSPIGPGQILESGGNAILGIVVFFLAVVAVSSVIDYRARHKKTVAVGIPKRVIRQHIRKEIATSRKEQRKKEITKITDDLEEELKDNTEAKSILKQIKESIARETLDVGELRALLLHEDYDTLKSLAPFVMAAPAGGGPTATRLAGIAGGRKARLEELVETPEERPVEEGAEVKSISGEEIAKPSGGRFKWLGGIGRKRREAGKRKETAAEAVKMPYEEKETEAKGEEAKKVSGGRFKWLGGIGKGSRRVRRIEEKPPEAVVPRAEIPAEGEAKPAKIVPEAAMEARGPPAAVEKAKWEDVDTERVKLLLKRMLEQKPEETANEREKLVGDLEKKLKTATEDAKKKERAQELLDKLKEKIREDLEAVKEEASYGRGDVEEITSSLRGRVGIVEPEAKWRERSQEEAKSLVAYGRAYSRGGEEDILKTVVSDVRQQLAKPEEAEMKKAGARWYEKGQATEQAPVGGMSPAAAGVESVELLEEGMFEEGLEGFGDVEGGLGELGDLSELENIDQSLESSDFDGMFVNMSVKGGCPHCGKKGSSVVYCSSCGKPLCSNCASSVEGSERFIKYKCPHCGEEFAMKRREAG